MINPWEEINLDDYIMIGDRFYDIDGAKANSIASIGVLYGYGNRKELEEAGYFRREQVREGGKIVKTEYVISEYKNCENPLVENPVVENPVVENPPQVNTKELITYKSNTKDIYTTEFENLWSIYPRKKGKENARKSYIKARKDGASYEDIEAGVVAYANYIKATDTDEQYIKYGSSFFTQRAW